MKFTKKKPVRIIILSIGFILISVMFLFYSAVDNSLTEQDRKYIPLYLMDIVNFSEERSYKDELYLIKYVQRMVLGIAKSNIPLALGQQREPKELYEAKTGLCYDRSRVIEKILRYLGFETRHISMYSTKKTNSKIKSLIFPGIPSHAITEVSTKNGWLIIDSNNLWISTDKNNQPISIKKIQHNINKPIPIQWSNPLPLTIYSKPFTFVYGLYSRHGKFYPPYNFIPDINYDEFIQNIF